MSDEVGPSDDSQEWEIWWNARVEAISDVLGEDDGQVLHALIPFFLGPEMGGAADVITFRKHLPGVCYVTSELIGYDSQEPNEQGNYELMICHREEEDWGAQLISRLAFYTCEAVLNHGDTMDIGPAAPEGSTISALLFYDYARFRVRDLEAGLLLCMGITEAESEACQAGRGGEVLDALKSQGIFPYTDLFRASVLT